MEKTQKTSPALTAADLRAMMRPGTKRYLPDLVADCLQPMELEVVDADAEEIGAILDPLIADARGRLAEEGFEPVDTTDAAVATAPKRERARAGSLSILLAFRSVIAAMSGASADAKRQAVESIGWARLADDRAAEARAWLALSHAHSSARSFADELGALRTRIEILRPLDEPVPLIAALNDLIAGLIVHDRLSEADPLLEEAFALVEQRVDDVADARRLMSRLLLARGRILTFRFDAAAGIAAMKEALTLSDPAVDASTEMAILTQLGSAYSGIGESRQSIEYQQRMIRVAEEHRATGAVAWAYFRIGESYISLGDYERSLDALDLSLQLSPQAGSSTRTFVLGKRAEAYLRLGRLDEAYATIRQVIDEGEGSLSPFVEIYLYVQLGTIQTERGDLEAAETAFRHALEVGARTETADRSANVYVSLAKVLRRTGRTDEAEALLRDVCGREVRTAAAQSAVAQAHALLAEIAEERGDYKTAFAESRAHTECLNAYHKREADTALKNARILAEVEMLEKKAQLERERRRQAESDLAQALMVLKGKSDLLGKVESQLHEALSGIAAEKAREITTSLKNALQSIDDAPAETDHPLHYLNSVDPDFFTRLRARHPGLTRKQERLCGLIRAGLTTQEIAAILDLGHEGMRAQRKRLRKKLGIGAEGSLEDVIGGI